MQGAPSDAVAVTGLDLTSRSGEVILQGIDWTVERGGVALVIGASGAGKSRLLRCINRLDERSAGEISILGRAVDDWPVGELRRAVGWVPQRPALSGGTGRHNLGIPARFGLLSREELDRRLPEALEVAALPRDLLDRPVSQLSGGERHRLAIARALTLRPQLLLLDEPSSALDTARAGVVLRNVKEWCAERAGTLVVVTHRLDDVRQLGGRVLVLAHGRVEQAGTAVEVLDAVGVRGLLTGERAHAGEGSA